MRHRAHFIVLTMPTDRSLGTMLSDSNDDVHTLQFAHRGECHRAVQGGDADRIPGFLQDESAGAIGRPSRAATAEFHDRRRPTTSSPTRISARARAGHAYHQAINNCGRGRRPLCRDPKGSSHCLALPRCPWMSVDARPTKTLDSRPSLRRYLPSERSVGHGAVFVLHGSPHRDPDTDAYS
jgi:hypothetical protein